MQALRIAITADLHWGIRETGDAATRALAAELRERPPDMLVLAGDIGAGDDFARCLELFDQLPCRKLLVPGNHDIWVNGTDSRGDSWRVYSGHLSGLCAQHGFHYLDHGPLLLPEADLAIVGTMNWYDYSWAIDELPNYADDWQERLRNKRFARGRHNDGRFVRWQFTDGTFTEHVVAAFERHLQEALRHVGTVIVVTHHPAFAGLNYPSTLPPHLDQLLWKAFSGNRALEQVLERNADRIALAFSGHTHKARENNFAGIRGHNIGGDYDWKRLLMLKWPEGTIEAREFR
jgi:3',5'-cyclic AMP phosphodiesterase CpdA